MSRLRGDRDNYHFGKCSKWLSMAYILAGFEIGVREGEFKSPLEPRGQVR